ncbi:hypothetical protein AKJ42_00520 [candidate division MSBL1 archaeon SCGC-AAA261C02]|uniref:Ribbon-helix-helix protein CopG domain-containing protein n=1 Tax=candidate division MSBL1 archaeon SCGC-AAA261C02 TaxID=1698272 RepID=A0A133V238_9EURY|nr:hypothetical protein AKJ42_00520 [candidate division MSBL1 archaeon SCGC-AAA261C02]
MPVTSVRLSDNLLKELDSLAEDQGVDRSTVLKRALKAGVREIRIDEAIKKYQDGLVSAWRAAWEARVSLWEFVDVLEKRGIGFSTSDEDLEEMLEEL